MGGSVLIIDADEAFAEELAATFQANGTEASTTGDGKLGLDLARINLPTAIVLCVELPRMSGYSVCAKLKKDDALKSVPVLITSSEATPETFEQHRKLKSRAEAYVKKPVDPQSVVSALAEHLGYPRVEDVVAESEEIAILDDELSVDNADGGTLGDDEAFSAAEAEALLSESAQPLEVPDLEDDQHEIDAAFRALSEPAGTGLMEAPGFDDDDDEALTTVAQIAHPPPSTGPRLRAQTANASGAGVMAQEIEGLRARVIELEESLTMAESERDAARVEASSSKRPSQLPTGSVISSRDALALKKQRNALEREIIELKEQMQVAQKEKLSWHESEEELEARVVELEEALTSAGDEHAATEAVLLGEQAKVAESQRLSQELKRRSAELAEHLEEAQSTLEAANAGLEGAQVVIAEKDSQLIARGEEAAGLHTRIGALEAELETSLEELDEVRGQSTAHERASIEAGEQLTALRAQAASYEKAAAEANAALATAKGEAEQSVAELARFQDELEATSAEAANLRQQLGSKADEISDLNGRLGELAEQEKEIQAETQALLERVAQAEASREETQGHLSEAYQKIQEDNIIRGKAMKAIEIALALVKEAGFDEGYADAEVDPEASVAEPIVEGDTAETDGEEAQAS